MSLPSSRSKAGSYPPGGMARGDKGAPTSRRARFKFQLYVANDAPNSAQAVANLTALCRAYLQDRYDIEIVDVFREPERALAEGILMTPTLVKLTPFPARRIVGTLSQTQPVLRALGLGTSSG